MVLSAGHLLIILKIVSIANYLGKKREVKVLFAVVEWCRDCHQEPFHTCLLHTKSQIVAESELEVTARPAPPFFRADRNFWYELIAFADGGTCPMCGRDYEF